MYNELWHIPPWVVVSTRRIQSLGFARVCGVAGARFGGLGTFFVWVLSLISVPSSIDVLKTHQLR